MSQPADYVLSTILAGDFDAITLKTREALAKQGFGILTEIDVRATLKKKLDVDHPRMVILGACNPPLAHRALTSDPYVSVLLPCNVVVRELPDGSVEVAAINPQVLATLIPNAEIAQVAAEADRRLKLALEEVGG